MTENMDFGFYVKVYVKAVQMWWKIAWLSLHAKIYRFLELMVNNYGEWIIRKESKAFALVQLNFDALDQEGQPEEIA